MPEHYVLQSGERYEAGQIEGIYPTLKEAKAATAHYSDWRTITQIYMGSDGPSKVRREWVYVNDRGWVESPGGAVFRA